MPDTAKRSTLPHSPRRYEMLIQDLTAQIETATEDREAKAQLKASKLQSAAEEKGDLADTTCCLKFF